MLNFVLHHDIGQDNVNGSMNVRIQVLQQAMEALQIDDVGVRVGHVLGLPVL